MTWTPKMIHAMLLRTPAPTPAKPLRVPSSNRPARQPSPRGTAAQETSGYGRR